MHAFFPVRQPACILAQHCLLAYVADYESAKLSERTPYFKTRKGSVNADIRRYAASLSFRNFHNRIAIDLDLDNGPRSNVNIPI